MQCFLRDLRLVAIGCVLVFALAGCATGTTTLRTPPTASAVPTATPAAVGRANCQPPSSVVGFEAQGTITTGSGELWALLMPSNGLPIHSDDDVKIVWRMTGSGDFAVVPVGPGGQHALVVFGPEYHASSNWNRPGQEWGTGFRFPVAGCWDLHAARTGLAGDLWLVVS